ncbi:MAG: Sec-independent protein translocase protein TatB [Burkholderiales bacterium]
MFDIGFSELLVLAVVALLVIGPERLPKVARTLGVMLGRMQRYVNDVKSDIQREMELDELKKLQASVEDSARTIQTSVSQELASVENDIKGTQQSVSAAIDEAKGESPAMPTAAPSPQGAPAAAERQA